MGDQLISDGEVPTEIKKALKTIGYNDIYFEEVKGVLDELNNTIIPLYEDLDEDEYVEFLISY